MAGFNHKIKKHIGSLYKEEAYVIINPKLLSVIECEVNE